MAARTSSGSPSTISARPAGYDAEIAEGARSVLVIPDAKDGHDLRPGRGIEQLERSPPDDAVANRPPGLSERGNQQQDRGQRAENIFGSHSDRALWSNRAQVCTILDQD